jgi:tRNA 2-thiouridine synthesizing protein A
MGVLKDVCQETVDKGKARSYQFEMNWDDEIDASGMLCPLPVLKVRKRLKGMEKGAVLRLLATDPAAVIDVPHYCVESGNVLVSSDTQASPQVYLIRRT